MPGEGVTWSYSIEDDGEETEPDDHSCRVWCSLFVNDKKVHEKEHFMKYFKCGTWLDVRAKDSIHNLVEPFEAEHALQLRTQKHPVPDGYKVARSLSTQGGKNAALECFLYNAKTPPTTPTPPTPPLPTPSTSDDSGFLTKLWEAHRVLVIAVLILSILAIVGVVMLA